ncbi:MAG: 30S ribosomal protein S6 [Alphaproteobacteria bacterium]|nr:30S ribosomal protein S6 [Alphaproteobacteria bacterium]
MSLYETVFIARQDLTVEDVDALTNKFTKIIADANGKVKKEYWGLRNLAYKVKKNTRGHYILLKIESEYPTVAELKRVMGYNEDVIRSAIYSVESFVDESPMFVSINAKDFKAGKVSSKKEPSKLDLVIDQFQFDA